ncbi:hypothetical protein [Thiocystis minor]|uniref:hypothetical protein n=1 Tax=Thiocystis minor TaxID=61597 RepID=UPI001912C690|nr:hypothetical protein [Thiocystis minor]
MDIPRHVNPAATPEPSVLVRATTTPKAIEWPRSARRDNEKIVHERLENNRLPVGARLGASRLPVLHSKTRRSPCAEGDALSQDVVIHGSPMTSEWPRKALMKALVLSSGQRFDRGLSVLARLMLQPDVKTSGMV